MVIVFFVTLTENQILIYFFECNWSKNCLQGVQSWLGWKSSCVTLERKVWWLQRSKVSKFRKQFYTITLAALVYMIWLTRNRRIWDNNLCTIGEVIDLIKQIVKNRALSLKCIEKAGTDSEWFANL